MRDIFMTVLGSFLLVFVGAWNLNADVSELVKGKIFIDKSAVSVGDTVRIGIRLEVEPGWHIYWKVSGDAGLPTKVDWKVSPGLKLGVDRWPLPRRFIEQESLIVYGYEKELNIFNDVIVENIDSETKVFDVEADVSWLICKEVCIPGDGFYQTSLPVGIGVPQNARFFEKDIYKSMLVPTDQLRLSAELISKDSLFRTVVAHDIKNNRKWIDFFPTDLDVGGVKTRLKTNEALHIEWTSVNKQPQSLSGVLVYELEPGESRGLAAKISFKNLESDSPNFVFGQALWVLLLMAFGGGLILNLMPCVLPVIAIKMLSITKHLDGGKVRIRRIGLSFSAGIIFSFLVLSCILIIFRVLGEELGWGFQFQYPSFIIGMSAIIFVLALSQFGVFTFRVPSVNRFPNEEEYIGSFFSGFLATILSTPCTAPLLGTAIGFAFTQSALIATIFFFFIGLGMACPHVLLALFPKWYKLVPKPGEWMERFKQAMAFLLMATVVWLLWVLGRQVGVDSISSMLCFLLCMSICCWLFGLPGRMQSTRKRRLIWLISSLISTFGYLVFVRPILASDVKEFGASMGNEDISWIAFSNEELNSRVSSGQNIFVNFTADWCITCKINEQTLLGRANVANLFASYDVALMRADWTNRNEKITKMLYSLGRSGVPAYVLFPGGQIDSPILLPEILTLGSIEEGLTKLERVSNY